LAFVFYNLVRSLLSFSAEPRPALSQVFKSPGFPYIASSHEHTCSIKLGCGKINNISVTLVVGNEETIVVAEQNTAASSEFEGDEVGGCIAAHLANTFESRTCVQDAVHRMSKRTTSACKVPSQEIRFDALGTEAADIFI
jgi:hypothetical protein